jgi:uncharacterized protein YbbK (DUF523 family)
MKIGVSSCLLGVCCTYNGKHHLVTELLKLYQEGRIVEACPEVLGGLLIPRDPSEIQSRQPLKICTNKGIDVTKEYCEGARKAVDIFLKNEVSVALVKYRSPSCGKGFVYDGTFSKSLVEGNGVFVDLLLKNGIKVFHENEIEDFLKYIGKEEEYGNYFENETSV